MIYVVTTKLEPRSRPGFADYHEGLEVALNRIAREGGRVLHLTSVGTSIANILYTIVYEKDDGGRLLHE